jgi:hypothetical protein
MLYVHEAIKSLAELVTIMKPDEILVYCFVITTTSGGANVQHHRYTYDAIRIKSTSPPNHLVTRHRLNDHQRRIVVQGDGGHDLCTGGSYTEAMMVLTSTRTSRPSKQQQTRTTDSRIEV